jgi:hypothetical protein
MRISATTLEMFRRRNSDEEFIKRITEAFKPTPQMEFGTAFDWLIQQPDLLKPIDGFFKYNNILVPEEPVMIMRDRLNPYCQFQLKSTKTYSINGALVTLVCKCDVLTGIITEEIKTTFRAFNYDNFEKSLQWRCYLEVFNSPLIYYHVFEFGDDYTFKTPVEPFYFSSYSNLSNDVRNALTELVTFIESKNLYNYFRDLAA